MAGAKERGELESRVTALISEVKKSGYFISKYECCKVNMAHSQHILFVFYFPLGKVILFIDEVHTLIGSGTVGKGNKGSGLDIANLLKPSLGRGELQVRILNEMIFCCFYLCMRKCITLGSA